MLPGSLARSALASLSVAIVALSGCNAQRCVAPLEPPAPTLPAQHDARSSCRSVPTALLFWAPSCEACKPWIASADRLWRRQATSVRLVGVAVNGSPEEIREALAPYRVSFPQAEDSDGGAQARFGVRSIPALVVLDGCETVVRRSRDGDRVADLERLLHGAFDPG